MTVSVNAVYAADRLMSGKQLTQAQVIEGGKRYRGDLEIGFEHSSRGLHAVFVDRDEVSTMPIV